MMMIKIDEAMRQSGVAFGTSGARGLVTAMTDRLCFTYVLGFLQHMGQIGQFAPGMAVALAGDLRPSTPRILAACAAAIRAAGGEPWFLGFIPTPALALAAFGRGVPSLMVTGSHIPDDRNGIKFYRADGEVLKSDEAAIRGQSVAVDDALFDDEGALRDPRALPPVDDVLADYVARYRDFFGADALAGMTLGIYQHSAVGRDVLVDIVEALGATARPLGRSDRFLPVDTEAVRDEDVAAARGWVADAALDAILSTDGDSDRPLLADAVGEWLRGDRLGILAARELGADSVVTPVSSNSAVERCGAFADVRRTQIGSPFVIDAMNDALADGRRCVVGYEANGGLLLGSPVERGARRLAALPTRDAVLPMLAALVAGRRAGGLAALDATLPPRVTVSDRLQEVPTDKSRRLFDGLLTADDRDAQLSALFGTAHGGLGAIDLTDGVRMTMADGTIVHLRPSGNAPELRCYTEADDADAAAAANRAALDQVRTLIDRLPD